MDSRTIASARARTPMIAALFVGLAALPSTASAEGEEVAGHPNYEERALLQLTNRARVDPQYEMEQCGMNCAEAACYDVRPPLYHKHEASRAARFHAAHMTKNGYFAHTSKCTLVPDISDLYPDSCDGAAACSCVGGTATCNPSCTSPQGRVGSFGAPYFGEIIAGGSSANQAFYLWLYEPTMDPSCMFTGENGHRWLLLTAGGAVGFGADGYYVGDFSGGGGGTKLASGSHWPRQSATVEAWTSWYDDAAPSKALVNVDGSCSPMSLGRGSAENGAYTASVSGVGQGCHRYFFVFEDSMGEPVYFPTTGSLGIGPAQGCEDWTPERPALGPGCDCAANCNGMQCGDDGCGGQCGSCG
ncbi:MAG: hypothetical protein KC636_12500, partial [Myxococcales bacterium]|nr:hypothetical protein [Myxococcales bacterium]